MRSISELLALRAGIQENEVRSVLDGRRYWDAPLRVKPRAEQAEQRDDTAEPTAASGMTLRGYSAVFDSDSELLFGFVREQIKRGAFKRVLSENPDVRLLENHEGRPYARTSNETLRLSEQPRGLLMEADLDESRSDAADLYKGVQRGDYSQQSFAFTVARDEWNTCECAQRDDYAGCDCIWDRNIREIGDLFEVSVVTFPAYSATSVETVRVSGSDGERSAQANDAEQRETAPPGASANDAGDTATAIRLWLIAN